MNSDRLKMPWNRPGDPYSTPRSLVLKLALGEVPENIPAFADVRALAAAAGCACPSACEAPPASAASARST